MSDVMVELSSFWDAAKIDPETYEACADGAYTSYRERERFVARVREYREQIERGEGETLKLAVALLILGNFTEALDWFAKAPDNEVRRYYAAQAALGLGRLEDALADLQRAASKGWDAFETDMQSAAIHIRLENMAAAEKQVAKWAASGADRAEWYYVSGLLSEKRGEREEALALYEKALTLDPDHAAAMFRCAWLYDMCGEDEQVIELYQRLALQPRAHVNALINLAVIYEDRGFYADAGECLRRILRAFPNHTRARLFLKDIESCLQMVIDDSADQRVESQNRLLDMPISEFELSVRARNCLKKMKIHTLGDLLRLTEVELLAYKNFGETSLSEIKTLLSQKGLQLGQRPAELGGDAQEPAVAPAVPVPPESEAVLGTPVSKLELSVRARRCLQRLGVATLGDLIQHSESDLLEIRNFGSTSLIEIKSGLAGFDLQLAPKQSS